MDLHYFKSENGNFGDDLNLWFWDEVLPEWREIMPDRLLVGVGSLLNDGLPPGTPKTVIGSGVAYGRLPDTSNPNEWDFRAVRGPRSAAALNLPPEMGIVDPAVLIADMPRFADVPRRPRPIFIPHHLTCERHDWVAVCAAAGVDYVTPEDDADTVIAAIAGAPLVVTESMHGAILADAFRVPWTAVRINHRFNMFKWQDWAESLEVDLEVLPLFPELERIARMVPRPRKTAPAETAVAGFGKRPDPMRLDKRARLRVAIERPLAVRNLRRAAQGTGQLSKDGVLDDRKARLRAVLADLRKLAPSAGGAKAGE